MDKIRVKGKPLPSGLPGTLMVSVADNEDLYREFMDQERQYLRGKKKAEPSFEYFFDLTIRRWYKRRSIDANNLQWELCTRIAAADHVSKESVHNAVREVFYPRIEYRGLFIPKDGAELTTVEYAKVIEALVGWCVDRPDPIEIHDIYVLWTEWRFGQEVDPLEGTYSGAEDYRERHPLCEACGKFLLHTDNEGTLRHAGQLAHIVSKGSGGPDRDSNWLVLCSACHVAGEEGEASQHQAGWESLLEKAPHLRKKVERARDLAGKSPLVSDAGESQPTERNVTPQESQAEKVLRIFHGEVVEGELPETVQAAPAKQPGLFDEEEA